MKTGVLPPYKWILFLELPYSSKNPDLLRLVGPQKPVYVELYNPFFLLGWNNLIYPFIFGHL